MKILFLEDEAHFLELGFDTNFSQLDATFGGLKNYKISAQELKQFDAVASILYHSFLANHLINKANLAGILTILIADGIFEWANATKSPILLRSNLKLYHPVVHDVFMCIGSDEKSYFESRMIKSLSYLPERLGFNQPNIPLPETPTFLITTANTAYFNEVERNSLLQLIKSVVEALERAEIGYKFRIFDKFLVDELCVDSKLNVVSGSYEEALLEFSAVITTPSSISITSMLHGRPVGHLIFRDEPQFTHAAWNFISGLDLGCTLGSMLKRDTDRMKYQEYSLQKYTNCDLIDNFEEQLASALKVEKQLFIENCYHQLVDSPLNLNFEYLFRKITKKLSKINILRHFIQKFRLR